MQKKGRFVLYSLAPILYNIGIILGAVVLYPLIGVSGLAWGVVLGAFLHLVIQVPFICIKKVFPRIIMPDWKQIFRIVCVSLPRSLTLASSQLSMLVLFGIGAGLSGGTIAVFTFANNIQSVPFSLIAVSYSVAAFPVLVAMQAAKDHRQFLQTIRTSLRNVVLWSLLATALFVVLRAQIVRTLLGSGAFDWNDTMLTGAVLAVFVLSLVAQGVSMLLVRSCYAMGKTLAPFFGAVLQFLVTVLAAWGSVQFLAHNQQVAAFVAELFRVAPTDALLVLALAFGYSVGAYVHALYMVVYVSRLYPLLFRGFVTPALQMLFATLIFAHRNRITAAFCGSRPL